MRRSYPYLNDIEFLNKIYDQHNQTVYTEITVLDWYERPVKQIQGRVLSASISVNGDSAVRRTANLSVKIFDNNELYTNIDSLLSINKKIFIETGLLNNIGHLSGLNYPSYKIIWFPFGTYAISSYSINHDATGVTVNLSLSDKMCLLNGSMGGVIPASTNFESYDTLGSDGDLHSEPIKINRIIPELVNHFGGEDLNNILVNDVPDRIKQVLRWMGSNPLFLYRNKLNILNSVYTTMQTASYSNEWARTKYTYNFDCGYTYTDFTYPGELTAGAGDSVCTVLDKIKETLGNYEYYYDVFGHFIFQEIRNYINTTEWRTAFNNYHPGSPIELPYAYNNTLNGNVYDLSKYNFAVSYSNAPKFDMIKNDFVVWGTREGTNGMKLPCRYHLAIDERPHLIEDWDITASLPQVNGSPCGICFDTHMDDHVRYAHLLTKRYFSKESLEADFPNGGMVGKYYLVTKNNDPNNEETGVYTWVTDIDGYKAAMDKYETAAQNDDVTSNVSTNDTSKVTAAKAGFIRLKYATYYTNESSPKFIIHPSTDWRNVLYWKGLIASFTGVDTGYYWTELCVEWPKIYDIEGTSSGVNNFGTGGYYPTVVESPSSLDWWLDIIDRDAALNKFSVSVIGRRSYAKTDSGCNCVFEPTIPDIIMVDVGNEPGVIDTRSQMTWQELREQGLAPIQVKTAIYNSTATGGIFNSCYEHVKQILQDYTDYNESITITCLPIYHLEPNTRIHVEDAESGIYGDYIINTLSYTLGNAGTMSISAKKVIEKI